jgi:hypothetical protein
MHTLWQRYRRLQVHWHESLLLVSGSSQSLMSHPSRDSRHEQAPGFPRSRFAWDTRPEGMILSRKPRPHLGRTNKEKIMTQLGTITSQLLNLRFDKIGSLFEEDGRYYVKQCLSPALIWHQRDSLGDDVARGPFQHDHDY